MCVRKLGIWAKLNANWKLGRRKCERRGKKKERQIWFLFLRIFPGNRETEEKRRRRREEEIGIRPWLNFVLWPYYFPLFTLLPCTFTFIFLHFITNFKKKREKVLSYKL